MEIELNKKYLITTDNWFMAPDGYMYRAVHGTVTSIEDSKELLGVPANRHSTNWYVIIGNLILAGCQVHYSIQTEKCCFDKYVREIENQGQLSFQDEKSSRIYNADQ